MRLGHGLVDLSGDLARPGEKGDKGGHIPHHPGRTASGPATAHQRYPLRDIVIFDLYPAAKERSERDPHGKTLLGRNRKYLICAVTQGNIVSDERKQSGVHCQARSQSRRMVQSASLSDCCVASRQRLVRKPETEKDNSQKRVR